MTQTGQCLCGAVQYTLEGKIGATSICHCKDCRRAHGGAFPVGALVRFEDFTVTAGESLIVNHKARHFCRSCGTRLYNRADSNSPVMGLFVASLDIEPSEAPSTHVNVASKIPWFEIPGSPAQYQGFPSEQEILKAYELVASRGSAALSEMTAPNQCHKER